MPGYTTGGFEAFGTLRQFAGSRRPRRNIEHCELCSLQIGGEHPHMVELASRRIVCACDACALLFDRGDTTRYKRVPRDAQFLTGFSINDAQWENLYIPINMAFFFYSSLEQRMIALYPSPAGAVESLLPLEAWQEIADANPAVLRLRPDVEALLVNRVASAQSLGPSEYYIAPLDQCYRLVGVIRTNWKGLSGGMEVWLEIGRFFSELRAKADRVSGVANA